MVQEIQQPPSQAHKREIFPPRCSPYIALCLPACFLAHPRIGLGASPPNDNTPGHISKKNTPSIDITTTPKSPARRLIQCWGIKSALFSPRSTKLGTSIEDRKGYIMKMARQSYRVQLLKVGKWLAPRLPQPIRAWSTNSAACHGLTAEYHRAHHQIRCIGCHMNGREISSTWRVSL